MTFAEMGLRSEIVRGVEAAGFKEPMPIQEKAIPVAMAGKDLVGCAQTGTGKTASYLLPMFQRFLNTPEGAEPAWGPRGLVLVPTRELAAQVAGCVKDYGRFLSLRAALVIGGVNFEPQVKALRNHPDLVIATPGRLLDQMGRGHVKFDSLQVLVLDEADRMLDMGFAKELDRILDRLPRQKQTLLFSATIPPEIESLCRGHLRNPVTVEVGQRAAPAVGIRHAVYPVPRHAKRALLAEILRRGQVTTSVLVFTRTKRGADRLARALSEHGRRVAVLHADRSQGQRDAALADFKAGRSQFLVATDIAARGLDVEGITHVINFDVPGHPEEYVHRVGRTARVDAEGDAWTLAAPEEDELLHRIERFTSQVFPRVFLPDFEYGMPPEVLNRLVRGASETVASKKPEVMTRPGRAASALGRPRRRFWRR